MRIRQLYLGPFRNFEHLELHIGARGALIVGDNGRGKSNILEAICYLSLGKSIRGARDGEAVPHGGGYFDVRGEWEDGDRARQARVYYSGTEGKRVFVDGAALPRVSDLVSQFHTVHFAPEDVALVLQFVAQRRRLLDILLSQASADYLRHLQRYGRVLTQRNHFLKQLGQRRADAAEREVWDRQLAVPGAAVRAARVQTLVEMAPVFGRCYAGFSTGREAAGIRYRDQALPEAPQQVPTPEAFEEELRAELASDPGAETRAGHTLHGPHRDAVGFTLDAAAADTYGSQGQLKSILLSWKMAESAFLEARSGRQPVLLFDDVFSELDPDRSQQLLRLAEDFEQVILTAPRTPADELTARFERIDLK